MMVLVIYEVHLADIVDLSLSVTFPRVQLSCELRKFHLSGVRYFCRLFLNGNCQNPLGTEGSFPLSQSLESYWLA